MSLLVFDSMTFFSCLFVFCICVFSSNPYPGFCLCVFFFLCCSVTRSRSSLSLVYVLQVYLFSPCMQAGWVGASSLCGLLPELLKSASFTSLYFQLVYLRECVEGVFPLILKSCRALSKIFLSFLLALGH